VRRIVLVGFMCSGKSTVGPALAARLGWEHLDLDREVERRDGRPVPRIFAEEGEPRFRALEAEATAALAGRERVVLSPGGGWITNPALLEALGAGTLSVWLRVSPGEVLARSVSSPGERPLLRGPDPLETVRALLAAREPFYRRADLAVETDGRAPEQVAGQILREAEARGIAP
jgi:shikimate kinase